MPSACWGRHLRPFRRITTQGPLLPNGARQNLQQRATPPALLMPTSEGGARLVTRYKGPAPRGLR